MQLAPVTGGNRGLGRSIVEALADDGVDAVFTYRSPREGGEGGRRSRGRPRPSREGSAARHHRDHRLRRLHATLRSTLREEWNPESFDILVNNAGFGAHTFLGPTDGPS
ncbi:SDR family NAD(P)-dependent oxidoreductase [Streptomyces sp. NPDC001953]